MLGRGIHLGFAQIKALMACGAAVVLPRVPVPEATDGSRSWVLASLRARQ